MLLSACIFQPLHQLHFFASYSDCSIVLFMSVKIGQNNYFCFSFKKFSCNCSIVPFNDKKSQKTEDKPIIIFTLQQACQNDIQCKGIKDYILKLYFHSPELLFGFFHCLIKFSNGYFFFTCNLKRINFTYRVRLQQIKAHVK